MDVHPVDYAIFCVLTASSLALGLYHSKRGRKKGGITVHTNSASVPEAQQEEVFLGGRSLPTWSLALSMLASGATGVGVVSMSAHQYAYGLHFLWDNVALAMTTPCIVFFVLPVLYRLKVTSVFEYIRMRFGSTVGISACIIYFFFSAGLVVLFSPQGKTALL
ncbi:hypothetical protein HPB49_008405 [Dermacentor silvarum]|uniref:Uncharacterized protein n=1 Tax=Dermacentor silvarum TaxID=543639 RepID=A0ACB8DNS7_DERSI|nr:hypothetical protein HPB49_008405 [Dermacentor silvarum]